MEEGGLISYEVQSAEQCRPFFSDANGSAVVHRARVQGTTRRTKQIAWTAKVPECLPSESWEQIARPHA